MDAKALKKIRKNLRTWYHRSSLQERIDGVNWYSDAQEWSQQLTREFNVTPSVAAAVISALSPNNRWERNKLDAAVVLAAAESNTPIDSVRVCTYNANKAKAFDIATGKVSIEKTAPKTFAFAKNVGDLDGNHVTIDKWHLRACHTTSLNYTKAPEVCTKKQYLLIEQETLKVAKEFNLKGYEFQAIIWVTIRNRWFNRL